MWNKVKNCLHICMSIKNIIIYRSRIFNKITNNLIEWNHVYNIYIFLIF